MQRAASSRRAAACGTLQRQPRAHCLTATTTSEVREATVAYTSTRSIQRRGDAGLLTYRTIGGGATSAASHSYSLAHVFSTAAHRAVPRTAVPAPACARPGRHARAGRGRDELARGWSPAPRRAALPRRGCLHSCCRAQRKLLRGSASSAARAHLLWARRAAAQQAGRLRSDSDAAGRQQPAAAP